MGGGDVHGVDVVEPAVIGFGHDGHGPCGACEMVGVAVDHPCGGPRMAGTDGMGVGDKDGAEEIARVIDPMRPRHLAIAVEREMPRRHGARGATVVARQKRRDAAAQADGGIGQGAETDRDACDIGDGIERAGGAGKRQAEGAGAGFCLAHGARLLVSALPVKPRKRGPAPAPPEYLGKGEGQEPVSPVHPCANTPRGVRGGGGGREAPRSRVGRELDLTGHVCWSYSAGRE